MKRWAKKIDLFSKKYVIIPINEVNHWSLCIVENPMACFELSKKIKKEEGKNHIRQ